MYPFAGVAERKEGRHRFLSRTALKPWVGIQKRPRMKQGKHLGKTFAIRDKTKTFQIDEFTEPGKRFGTEN